MSRRCVRLHADVPRLALESEEVDALLSEAALDRRPLAQSTYEPFTLV